MTKKILPLILILLAATPALAAPGDETAPPRPARPSNSGMMRYDTNKDGFVDRTEWTAGQEARFKQLDTDKDSKLSKDELFSRAPQTPGTVLPNDRAHERQDAFFHRMDSDRDGTISKAEFMAQADRNSRAATRTRTTGRTRPNAGRHCNAQRPNGRASSADKSSSTPPLRPRLRGERRGPIAKRWEGGGSSRSLPTIIAGAGTTSPPRCSAAVLPRFAAERTFDGAHHLPRWALPLRSSRRA